jgi:hypothetical protein
MNERTAALLFGVVLGAAIVVKLAAKQWNPLFTVRVVHEHELGDDAKPKPFWLRAMLSRLRARSPAGERAGSRLTPGSESTHAGARPHSRAHDASAA